MQPGGEAHREGKNPANPPPPLSSANLGLDSVQQQQLAYRQLLQQIQGNDIHGGNGISKFPSSFSLPQFREEHRVQGQGVGQHVKNPVHQSHLQYDFQAAQKNSNDNVVTGKQGNVGPFWKSEDILVKDLKAQESSDQVFTHTNKQTEIGYNSNDQRNDPQVVIRQLPSTNMIRPMQSLQSGVSMQRSSNCQPTMNQLQAIQTWAQEHSTNNSLHANVNVSTQVPPMSQSARTPMMLIPSETSGDHYQPYFPPKKQQALSPPYGSGNSAHGNSSSDLSGQAVPVKSRQTRISESIFNGRSTTSANSNDVQSGTGNRVAMMQLSDSSGSALQTMELSDAKSTVEMQRFNSVQQLNQTTSQHVIPSGELTSNQIPSHGGKTQMQQERVGFTSHQFYVLKAQMLAFKRLKRGERALPQEVLQAIVPLPLDSPLQQAVLPSGAVNQERLVLNNGEQHASYAETNLMNPQFTSSRKGRDVPKIEGFTGKDQECSTRQVQGALNSSKEPVMLESVGNLERSNDDSRKSEPEVERGVQNISTVVNFNTHEGKSLSMHSASSKILPKNVATRKYHGPLFDFPTFARTPEFFGSANANNPTNLTLKYDVKDLLLEEGMDVFIKKRSENIERINGLLAVNLESKRIRPDLVLLMQIEEKKLRLFDLQTRMRDEVEQQQQEIMEMSDRPYRKFLRECKQQRTELFSQVQQLQKVSRDKLLKSIFQWRKKLLEAHWGIRDARIARNRGVGKYHERMLKEFSKGNDKDRNKRMEALKNNDVDRYREILLEQQTNVPGDASQRYAVLSSFLSQTEEYLHKLGGKITATKSHQEVEEAENAAAATARAQGLSEEEVKAAASCVRQELKIRNSFSEMNAPKGTSSVNKYYNLAHAVNEIVTKQPSSLKSGTLRDYQIVGLQWMLSLYNNKLNGILADEMGLGKTVQVMALIAYLMEFKGNYGPHLIIVPNAVLVNWKSELLNWLPSVSCIFYVGVKDQRSKLFARVKALKFNILVTTYEFIMYDRSKLSKIDWKYIVIDEAQRMKDRESVLARDLDRYRCQRRLLLTGTPLQNDLRELWSLLNLLLPDVFDNSKVFHEWFSKPFQRGGPSHSSEEDDWLETEKKVIIIHRLHQILEPFMLRRRVEDVEGSLPPKVAIVLRCRMSGIQSAIYDWIRSTGTIRVDPEEELERSKKNPKYQIKMHKNLKNRCMELRKVCNHPLLNYPFFNDFSKEFIVRSCGKLWVLDRILIKLERAGHRVLLFSTMTKLLDILEEYLQWRQLVYRRIDGTTSLEDRESAIVDFNGPNSDCFIFLLSIRAAGRGLNLQSADTVVIYDPDSNPQNEEQAVARAHRIGQKREVKVIYLEAVADKIPSYQKEDELKSGCTGDSEDDLSGKDRYVGSIESLIRTNIQQYKMDMADEVINAGRFDQRTTHEERRMTLETLLHDEERYQETMHDVPSLQEVNRLIARTEEEIVLFDQMDDEFEWTREMVKYNQVPEWLRAGSIEVNALAPNISKKSSKNVVTGIITRDSNEIISSHPPNKTEKRVRPKRGTISKEFLNYLESDDSSDDYDASLQSNTSVLHEEGETRDHDEESNGAVDSVYTNQDQEEETIVNDGGGYDTSCVIEHSRTGHLFVEGASTGMFESHETLDARLDSLSKRMPDEPEEGEIAVSGDSNMNLHRSESYDHDDGEDEQVQQPKIKRKRSIRVRHRSSKGRHEEKCSGERVLSQCVSQLPLHRTHEFDTQLRTNLKVEPFTQPAIDRNDTNTPLKQKRDLPLRKVSPEIMHSRGSWNHQVSSIGGPSFLGSKMLDSTQRKCKNVISKLQRRVDKEGHQMIPNLYEFWKRNGNSSFASSVAMTSNLLHLQTIEQNVDNFEYNNVPDFISDVQLMLKNIVRQCNYAKEVTREAAELQDLFFHIMNIAFPDADFREERNTDVFSNHRGSAAASPTKPMTKHLNMGPASKEIPASGGARDSARLGSSPFLSLPRNLVVCKKKRKDRDKPASKLRTSASPLNASTVRVSSQKDAHQVLQGTVRSHQTYGSEVLSELKWGRTGKRMRTDAAVGS